MKSAIIAFTLLLSTTSLYHSSPDIDIEKADYKQEMLEILENQKTYILRILDQMPEDKFDFRPATGSRSFAELFKHITGSMRVSIKILNGKFTDIQTEAPAVFQIEKAPMEKAEIKKVLTTELDSLIAALKGMSTVDLEKEFTFDFIPGAPVRTNREFITSIRDHVTHHRAQATVYLRLNGIVPTAYVPW